VRPSTPRSLLWGKPTHKASTHQPFIYPLHAVTYSHRMALSGEWEGSLIPKSTSPFCNSAPPPARLPCCRVGGYLSRPRQHWAPSCTSVGTALSRCRSPSLLYTQSLSLRGVNVATLTGSSPWQRCLVVLPGVFREFLLSAAGMTCLGPGVSVDHGVARVASLTSLEAWFQGSHPPDGFQVRSKRKLCDDGARGRHLPSWRCEGPLFSPMILVILCSWGMLSEDCRLARWHVAALWCHVTSSSMNPGQRLLSLCLLIDVGIRQRGVRPRSDAMCFPFFRSRSAVKAKKATLEDVQVFCCPPFPLFCCNNYPS
jgi:hypothetical protein